MGKNHMEEVTKMLGIKMGEQFEINGRDGQYVLLKDGLLKVGEILTPEITYNGTLMCLITGELTITQKPWKPKDGDHYYYVNQRGMAQKDTWAGCTWDVMCYKLGDCYKTLEETNINRDKWKAFFDSDDVIDVFGG